MWSRPLSHLDRSDLFYGLCNKHHRLPLKLEAFLSSIAELAALLAGRGQFSSVFLENPQLKGPPQDSSASLIYQRDAYLTTRLLSAGTATKREEDRLHRHRVVLKTPTPTQPALIREANRFHTTKASFLER